MKNSIPFKRIALWVLVTSTLCFLAVTIFSAPAFIHYLQLDTTDKANIGSAINGMTAPILGLASSILLYLALSKQVESNNSQRLKNESDTIFLLFEQLENEMASFYWKYEKTLTKRDKKEKIEIKYTGVEGFNEFCTQYSYKFSPSFFAKEHGMSFRVWRPAGQITLIVDTFNLLSKRIVISTLSEDMRQLFQNKLDSYYECRLAMPLGSLAATFDLYESQKDSLTDRIQDLVDRQKNNPALADVTRNNEINIKRKLAEKGL